MENNIITNAGILNGKPIIKGTRISIEFIMELLSSGMNIEEIIKEYPQLKRDDVLAALNYATQILRHEEIYLTTNFV